MIAFFELKHPTAKPLQIGLKSDRTLYLPSDNFQHYMEAGLDGVTVFRATDNKRPNIFYPAQWLIENCDQTPEEARQFISDFLNSPTQKGIIAELEQEGFFAGEVIK